MRIGFDISVLHVAQAGVLRYTILLLAHLIEAGPEHEFRLLDYMPAQAGLPAVHGLSAFRASNVTVARYEALRPRKFANWRLLQGHKTGAWARAADRALEPGWKLAVRWTEKTGLSELIEPLDVFHSSDVFQYQPAHGASVVTVHDLTPLLFPEFHVGATVALHEAKLRFAVGQAGAIIADSECTRRDLVQHLQVPESRVRVVYPAASPDFKPLADGALLRSTAERYGLEGPGYLLHVGTLEPRKNLETLVDAYARLRRRGPAPLLALVGWQGWRFESIYRRVEALDLGPYVRFLGYVPDADLPALMNGAAAFVYPSLYEGFGLPPLEAMACGVPVVCSNAASLPEVVGDACLLIDPRDAEALAEALWQALHDEELRSRLTARGLAQAARFSWQATARETLDVYAAAGRGGQ